MNRIIAVGVAAAGIALLVPAPRALAEPTAQDLVHDAAFFCRLMDASDGDPAPVFEKMYYDGLDGEYSAAIVTYAGRTVCPEYAQTVVDYLEHFR